MKTAIKRGLLSLVITCAAYLLLWPVPVAPVAWQAPSSEGYTGDFSVNQRLSDLQTFDILGRAGPEDATIGTDGSLYFTTGEGDVLRRARTGEMTVFASNLGRALGITTAPDGTIWVADAYRGLTRLGSDGPELMLTQTDDGVPIRYANSLDFAPDGAIWLTDASTKFGAEASGGTLEASYLEILEHGRTGRIIRFDPTTGTATTALSGISFANGLAMGPTGQWLFFVETGSYALRRLWIDGPRTGDVEDVLTNLPGFPDNLKRDPNGGYLLGLVSKRAAAADMAAPYPILRKILQRLPSALRPKAVSYGFILHLDENGQITRTWQDPAVGYPLTTGAVRDPDGSLWVTSLSADVLARLPDP
ncbi:SMP-30/gluconolactonase/LRE family protein [Yoonia sp.]|uniref:SMP-30/gluconolactonase/LRE family protein n=1 Tax=Yoonia sp. TaxID=2212373 RepID=UPI0035C86173